MASFPPDRLLWLLCTTPSSGTAGGSELYRAYQKYSASVHSMPVVLKAKLCRFLVARALHAGALVHESGIALGLSDVKAGGVSVPVGRTGRGGIVSGTQVAAEASIVANTLLSTSGSDLTQLKRLIDHPDDATSVSVSSERNAATNASGLAGPRTSILSSGVLDDLTPATAPDLTFPPAHVDMVALLSLLPPPMAAHVLHHISVEAASASKGSSEFAVQWPVKLYCDFDDTVQPRLFDRSFPANSTYPGFVPFVKALRGDLLLARPVVKAAVCESTAALVSATQSLDVDQVEVDSSHRFDGSETGSESEQAHKQPQRRGVSGSRYLPGIMPLSAGFAGRRQVLLVSDIALTASVASLGRGGALRRVESKISSSDPSSPTRPVAGHAGSALSSSPGSPGRLFSQSGAGPLADLVFLSARPAFMRGQTLEAAQGMGLGHAAVLCGTISGALNHTRLAARKLRNHLLHHALFPEFRVLFMGDTGQADVRFAILMLKAHAIMYGDGDRGATSGHSTEDAAVASIHVVESKPVPPLPLPGADIACATDDEQEGEGEASESALNLARGLAEVTIRCGHNANGDVPHSARIPAPLALIHDICGADQQPLTSPLERARLRAMGVHVFDSYVEAALVAHQAGMISHAALVDVIDATTTELAAVRFGPGNEAQRVMRLQEYTMAVRRCHAWDEACLNHAAARAEQVALKRGMDLGKR